jgi:hypothetical protein
LAPVRPLGPVRCEELGWAGCWVWSGGRGVQLGRWVRWPVAGDGDPDRHRGWLLTPLPLLRAGGCRPGAEAARVLGS